MRISFYPLDISYENLEECVEIRLWGISDNGERCLLIDRNFTPYFYVKLKDDNYLDKFLHSLPATVKAEIVDKKYIGRKIKVVKITVGNQDKLQKLCRQLSKNAYVDTILEDDIRPSNRYIIDKCVYPCQWYEVDIEEEEECKVSVDKVYTVRSFVRPLERYEVPKLRVMAFSMACYSKIGSPNPSKDPVVVLAVNTIDGHKEVFLADDLDDKRLIQSFISLVRSYDPDVIVGYETNRRYLPYLITRARVNGLKLAIDRTGSEPHTSLYGHVSITGRVNIDMLDFAEDVPEVKLKTLENIADYFGVKRLSERTVIDESEIPRYWEDKEKRDQLVRYVEENAECLLGLCKLFLDYIMQLSNIVSLPPDHVLTAAVGFRVEWYLIREASKRQELIPKRVERPYLPYAGAIVLEPRIGIHSQVVVLDFKSMYPSIMIAYNVSPDTYTEEELEEEVHIAPEVRHKFRKEPPGFYKQVLEELISTRDAIRKKMKQLDALSATYRVLDARQKAIKVITNACYGYAGWIGARWYLKPVAEATTAWARSIILKAINLARDMGLEIIYGDTDSLFIRKSEKIEEFIERVKREIGFEVKIDKVFKRVLFTEAKKRYAGLTEDNTLEVVGLEVIRGDWANIARRVQEDVLKAILIENSKTKAIEVARQYIGSVRKKKRPFSDFVIWKTLTKPIEDYEVRGPHIEAARLLIRAGWKVSTGDKIGYVITAGSGKLYERAKPYIMASIDEIDVDYYITHQVIPAALRVLSVLGVDEKAIKEKQGTLLSWI